MRSISPDWSRPGQPCGKLSGHVQIINKDDSFPVLNNAESFNLGVSMIHAEIALAVILRIEYFSVCPAFASNARVHYQSD